MSAAGAAFVIVRPVFFLRGLADAWVQAVGWVLRAVEVRQGFFGVVEVADVVFCRVFRAFAVEVCKQQVFDGSGVGAGFQDVVLVHDVAEEVAVVEFMRDVLVNFRRQAFEPVAFVAAQGDVEREQVANFFAVYGVVAVRGAGSSEAVQGGLCAFSTVAGVVGTNLTDRKSVV